MIQRLHLNVDAMLLISDHAIFVKKYDKIEFRRYIESDVGRKLTRVGDDKLMLFERGLSFPFSKSINRNNDSYFVEGLSIRCPIGCHL